VSILARVFVVLNFALAVAFLIFSVTAYSKRVKYYDNWKQEEKAKAAVIAEKDAIIGEKDKKIAEQTATIAERDREVVTSREELKKIGTQLFESEKQKVVAMSATKLAEDKASVLLEQVGKMRQDLETTREVVLAQQKQIVQLDLDAKEYKRQLVDSQNENNLLKGNIDVLNQQCRELAENLRNAEYMVAQYMKINPTAVRVGPVPDVRTKVVDVRLTTGIVALGQGKNSGIKEGMIFLISRGDEYIGKVRITQVDDDLCAGQIIDSTKSPIKPGDDAMTHRS
jgi:septal ring factor EnvC (AmiA/AmiB activator)